MPPPEPGKQRLFFALWPPVELSRALHALADQPPRTGAVRRVHPENIHLTLAFLGPVSESYRECAEQAASQVGSSAFTLKLELMDCWPKPGIQWAGPVQAPEALINLVRELNRLLGACGYVPESRPYAAHLTLARGMHAVRESAAIGPLAWDIGEFHLVRSQTGHAGARYEILRSWPLISRPA